MKLKKAVLHQGVEIPTNEPKLSSEMYELEIVPTNVGGMLKARPKTTAIGAQGEFYVPLTNVSYFIAEQEPKAATPAKK